MEVVCFFDEPGIRAHAAVHHVLAQQTRHDGVFREILRRLFRPGGHARHQVPRQNVPPALHVHGLFEHLPAVWQEQFQNSLSRDPLLHHTHRDPQGETGISSHVIRPWDVPLVQRHRKHAAFVFPCVWQPVCLPPVQAVARQAAELLQQTVRENVAVVVRLHGVAGADGVGKVQELEGLSNAMRKSDFLQVVQRPWQPSRCWRDKPSWSA